MNRLAHVPVVFMSMPRVPPRARRARTFRRRAWAGIVVGLCAVWGGLGWWALS